jgi:hypothetical protein
VTDNNDPVKAAAKEVETAQNQLAKATEKTVKAATKELEKVAKVEQTAAEKAAEAQATLEAAHAEAEQKRSEVQAVLGEQAALVSGVADPALVAAPIVGVAVAQTPEEREAAGYYQDGFWSGYPFFRTTFDEFTCINEKQMREYVGKVRPVRRSRATARAVPKTDIYGEPVGEAELIGNVPTAEETGKE